MNSIVFRAKRKVKPVWWPAILSVEATNAWWTIYKENYNWKCIILQRSLQRYDCTSWIVLKSRFVSIKYNWICCNSDKRHSDRMHGPGFTSKNGTFVMWNLLIESTIVMAAFRSATYTALGFFLWEILWKWLGNLDKISCSSQLLKCFVIFLLTVEAKWRLSVKFRNIWTHLLWLDNYKRSDQFIIMFSLNNSTNTVFDSIRNFQELIKCYRFICIFYILLLFWIEIVWLCSMFITHLLLWQAMCLIFDGMSRVNTKKESNENILIDKCYLMNIQRINKFTFHQYKAKKGEIILWRFQSNDIDTHIYAFGQRFCVIVDSETHPTQRKLYFIQIVRQLPTAFYFLDTDVAFLWGILDTPPVKPIRFLYKLCKIQYFQTKPNSNHSIF